MHGTETLPLPGDRFAGRYQIVDEVGAGGMGTVFRAIDEASGGQVAVKIVHVVVRSDEVRFDREAAALGGTHHPAVVRYLGHGCERGVHYLVMEWLDGRTLDDYLAHVGISPAETLELAGQVAAGLAAVHARGLVHRDIKPSNLMLVGGAHDQVTILDFGVVRPTGSQAHLTHTGLAVGTPGYMSPEQTRGERALDARSDIFSLGCVIYECLTGRAPFLGAHPTAVRTKILLQDPVPLVTVWPEAPPALCALIDDCLSKKPARRPADGGELARRLAELPPIDRSLPRRLPSRSSSTSLSSSAHGPDTGGAHDAAALVSMLMALPAGGPPVGLFGVARGLGAKVDMLGDGTILVELAGGAAPRHAGAVASLVALLGPGVLALATGPDGPDAHDLVAERAARAFEAEAIAVAQPTRSTAIPHDALRTDEETVGLLAPLLTAIAGRASYLVAGPRGSTLP